MKPTVHAVLLAWTGWVAACHLAIGADEFAVGTNAASGGAGQGGEGTGGAGTTGTAGGGNGGVAGSGAAAGAGGGGGMGGGGGTADPCDLQGQCNLCVACAVSPSGSCYDEVQACQSNPDCAELRSCLDGCGQDQICKDDCRDDYPPVINQLQLQIPKCALCEACVNDCAGVPTAQLCNS